MNKPRKVATLIGALSIGAALPFGTLLALRSTEVSAKVPSMAPEFTHRGSDDWLNSPPLSLQALRGKPVLVEFWTFDCINCRRSIPWMRSVQQRFPGLTIVGVHTPELAQERVPENVRESVKRLGITYPVMIDADFSYWRALNNEYWPAFYLIDANGRITAASIGEMHVEDARAAGFEAEIGKALSVGPR
jgi:thiol-disulfide isomerase/thioredoxin